jgi:hypothetical protein
MNSWLEPYTIEKFHDNDSIQIKTIDEEIIPLLVNGFRLKVYSKPLTRDKLIETIKTHNMDMIDCRYSLNPSK